MLWTCSLYAQDPIYSQYYITPNLTNPAFVGNSFGPYVSMQYRDRWNQHLKPYRTFTASYGQRWNEKHGVGAILTSDYAFNGALVSNKIAGQYSLRVNLDKDTYLRGGVEIGVVDQRLNREKLVFYDNLDPIYGQVSSGGTPIPTQEVLDSKSARYLDIGTGLMFNTKDYYVGLSLQHLNRARINFINEGRESDRKDMMFSMQGGYQINSKFRKYKNVYLTPNFLANVQGGSWQVQLGAIQNVENVYVGTWYRYATRNSDALIFGIGLKQGRYKMSYSFDYPLSKINLQSGGTHEIGLSLNFDDFTPKKKIYDDCFTIFR